MCPGPENGCVKTNLALQITQERAYMYVVSSETMNINALAISGSDPGAVPGVSTKYPSFGDHGDEIGSTNV